jgi:hypothetical protein
MILALIIGVAACAFLLYVLVQFWRDERRGKKG